MAGLQERGLSAGDKVAFLMDNGLYTAEVFLGVMYGGMVAAPLNVRAIYLTFCPLVPLTLEESRILSTGRDWRGMPHLMWPLGIVKEVQNHPGEPTRPATTRGHIR